MTLLETVAVKARSMTKDEIIAELDKLVASHKRTPSKALTGDYAVNVSHKRIMWPSPVCQVDYTDGTRVRMSFATLPGKPLNLGRALRVCAAAYEQRKGRAPVEVKRWQIESATGIVLAKGVGDAVSH